MPLGLILSLSKDGATESVFCNDRLERTELEEPCASS